MNKGLLLLLLFLFFQLGCSSEQFLLSNSSRTIASQDTIKDLIIYIDAPRGGLGDVASNLLMAKMLQEKGMKISLVVNNEAQKSLKILLPEYDPNLEISLVNNLKIYPENPNFWPPGDALVAFSSNGNVPEKAKYSKNYTIYEYSDIARVRIGDDYSYTAAGSNHIFKTDFGITTEVNEESIKFSTIGGINHLGAYIREEKSIDVLSLEKIYSNFSNDLGIKNIKLNSPKVKIGFSYTNKVQSTQLYLNGVVEYIKSQNIEENVVVFVKNFENLDTSNLPLNLTVVKFDSIPFEVSRSLIAHSNIPIMVTGDVSLTLALDFEKLFFYEMNEWKQHLASDIVESLFSNGTAFLDDIHSVELKKILYQMLSLSSDAPELTIKEVAAIFNGINFQKKFSASVSKIRKKYSLPKNFIELMKITELFNFHDIQGGNVLPPFMSLYFEQEPPSSRDIIEYAYKAFSDSKKNSDFKLRLFYSFLNLKDFKNDVIQNKIIKIIENSDESFLIALNDLFKLNMGKGGSEDKFVYIAENIYRSDSEVAKKKISSIILQLANKQKVLIPQGLLDISVKDLRIERPCNQLIHNFLN